MHSKFGLSALGVLTVLLVGMAVEYRAYSQANTPLSSGALFRPFTARIVENHYLPGSTTPHTTIRATYARRTDGSDVSTFTITAPDGTVGEVKETTDYRLLVTTILEPFTKSVSTFHHSAEEMQRLNQSQRSCGPDVLATTAQHLPFLGYDGVRRHVDLSGDQSDLIVAPVLDCYALEDVFTSSKGTWSDRKVVEITETEPPDFWFQPPADYVERAPSLVEAEYTQRFRGYALFGERLVKSMDFKYHSRQ